jgi:hypothetical protein
MPPEPNTITPRPTYHQPHSFAVPSSAISQQSPLLPLPSSPVFSQTRSWHGSPPGQDGSGSQHSITGHSPLFQSSPSIRSGGLRMSTRSTGDHPSQDDGVAVAATPSVAVEPGTGGLSTRFPQTSYTFPSPYFLSPDALHGLPEESTDAAYTGLQEACLIRHFVENLAHSVCIPVSSFSITNYR